LVRAAWPVGPVVANVGPYRPPILRRIQAGGGGIRPSRARRAMSIGGAL